MSHTPVAAGTTCDLLIVEDDDDSREMLTQLAQLYGYSAAGAATAGGALDLVQRCQPKLALIDIGLADADGFEVARRVRQLPGGAGVRLVALTGYSDDDSRRLAKAAGFDDFVVKPLTPERLNQLLSTPVT
jgi:CheY-like chemotaxis protein